MRQIKFNLTPAIGVESELLGGGNLMVGTRHGNTGGAASYMRVGITRVALAKLSATGVLAAIVAISASDREAAFSCGLAAAANFVACAHYHYILREMAKGGREEGEHSNLALSSQQMGVGLGLAVDALRCVASQDLIYTAQPAT
tara:strand:- start:539 stop:970 length:432 start_codon:yes stop_codon:yes gene_type:complete